MIHLRPHAIFEYSQSSAYSCRRRPLLRRPTPLCACPARWTRDGQDWVGSDRRQLLGCTCSRGHVPPGRGASAQGEREEAHCCCRSPLSSLARAAPAALRPLQQAGRRRLALHPPSWKRPSRQRQASWSSARRLVQHAPRAAWRYQMSQAYGSCAQPRTLQVPRRR